MTQAVPICLKTEKLDLGEDLIQFLLSCSVSSLTREQLLQIKCKRPTPCIRPESGERNHKRYQFQEWYAKFPWLAGCTTTNHLFCFSCLLFGGKGSDEWTNVGVSNLKKFDKKAHNHQRTRLHIKNLEAYQMLGKCSIEISPMESCRLAAEFHNKQAESRRVVLRQIVHEICRLGKQGIAIEHCVDNNLLEGQEVTYNNSNFEDPCEPLRIDHVPIDQRRQLIQAIAAAMLGKMKEELAKASFVSIQIDEVYEVTPTRQVSVILRYCIETKVIERFVGLYDLPEWGDLQLSIGSVVLKMIEEWQLEGRLVAQSYDGASLIPAGDCTVQAVVTDAGHRAPMVHSYMHRLDLVLLYGTLPIKEVRNLFGNLNLLKSFYNAPKRRQRLINDGVWLPISDDPKWLSTVHEHFPDITNLVNSIVSNDQLWDPETVLLATYLKQRLDDYEFVYLLCFYHAIFLNFIYPIIEYFDGNFAVYASCTLDKLGKMVKDMRDLNKDVLVRSRVEMSKKLNSHLTFEKEIPHVKQISEEIIIDMTRILQIRFKDHQNLTVLELLCEPLFPKYAIIFPKHTLKCLVTYYPLFDEERLESELYNLYDDERKHLPPADLLDYLVQNELDQVYIELCKLLRLALCLPLVNPYPNDCTVDNCLLTRIKKAAITPEISEYMAVLHVENELLDSLTNDQSFKERVIDLFAVMGERPELIYQSVT